MHCDTQVVSSERTTTPGGVDIVRTDLMAWGESLVKHRHASAMRHKRIFDGVELTPDNYSLALADESSEYFSPSHRHLWDQVRYCINGSVPIGRNMSVAAGEVAYFPEGVRYGPQKGGPDRLVLVLQFGGASRNGYLSPEQIDRGRSELEQVGTFDTGLYRRTDGAGRAQQDAYEAVWEHVLGESVVYPEATVQAPIVLRPSAFSAVEVDGAPGVRRRWLGTFQPRGLRLDILEIDAGATVPVVGDGSTLLWWVIDGDGVIDGGDVRCCTAIRAVPGASSALSADRPMHVLAIGIPTLSCA
jgi:hypothetical protein